MIDQQINEAIAELVGVTLIKGNDAGEHDHWNTRDGKQPDYVNDLNAMHEAWDKSIPDRETDEIYCRMMHEVCCPDKTVCKHPWDCSYTINATARQRAIALVRVFGK